MITPQIALEKIKSTFARYDQSADVPGVLDALSNRRAFLFINRSRDGFVVMQPNREKSECWVVFAYNDSPPCLQHYTREVISIANITFRCKAVCFQSKRRGYLKIMPSLGFRCERYEEGIYFWRYE